MSGADVVRADTGLHEHLDVENACFTGWLNFKPTSKPWPQRYSEQEEAARRSGPRTWADLTALRSGSAYWCAWGASTRDQNAENSPIPLLRRPWLLGSHQGACSERQPFHLLKQTGSSSANPCPPQIQCPQSPHPGFLRGLLRWWGLQNILSPGCSRVCQSPRQMWCPETRDKF